MFKVNLDISELSKKGENLLLQKDKFLLKKANNALDRINEELSGIQELDKNDLSQILDEYWSLCNDKKRFQEIYAQYKKRKRLMSVFSSEHNGKRICLDGNLTQFLSLYSSDTSELVTLRMCNMLVSSWYFLQSKRSAFKEITGFLKSRIDRDLKNKKLKTLKSNIFVLNDKFSTNKLAQLIVDKNLSVQEGFKYVGLNFISEYFYTEQVILDTFKLLFRAKRWEGIEKIVDEIHLYSIRLKKNIISAYTIENDKLGNKEKLRFILSLSIRLIGDPSEKYKWEGDDSNSTEDNNSIEKARIILNKLVVAEFLDVFFTELINEQDRRLYWLSKIDSINDIKIYGSSSVKMQLSYVNSIKGSLRTRFKIIGGAGSNAGIIMDLNNSQILEFTDSGAIYCYRTVRNRIPKNVNNLSDLRDNEVKKTIASSNKGIFREGRVIHRTDGLLIRHKKIIRKASWMYHMDNWLKHYE
jgi:hypothetical protein